MTALPDELVVCSLEPWDEIWRRNQLVVDGLLRRHPRLRVLFVEPPHDLASGLLRLLACFASEQIPLRLLLRPRPELAGTLLEELPPLLDDPLAADEHSGGQQRNEDQCSLVHETSDQRCPLWIARDGARER